jgi:hypothetical protein
VGSEVGFSIGQAFYYVPKDEIKKTGLRQECAEEEEFDIAGIVDSRVWICCLLFNLAFHSTRRIKSPLQSWVLLSITR